jgi:hypothetical protein
MRFFVVGDNQPAIDGATKYAKMFTAVALNWFQPFDHLSRSIDSI